MTARITLSTASVYPESCEQTFRYAADYGYDGVEVMVTTDPVTQDTAAVAELSRRFGVPTTSIHAPCLLITQFVWGTDPTEKLRRSVRMADDLGAGVVVIHPPFRWQRDYADGFLELVEELSSAGGAQVSVENMFPWWVPGRRMGAYAPDWDPRTFTTPHVTLDVSHCAAAQVECTAMASDLSGRLRHVHFTDGSGSAKDEHLVPGQGNQPVAALVISLGAAGFDGDIVLELNTRRVDPRVRASNLAESMSFIRTALLRSGRFGIAVSGGGTADLIDLSAADDPLAPAEPAAAGIA